ncbi:MAG: methionine adenosyltransferase [Candidatus Nanohaloarchaea archaeon]
MTDLTTIEKIDKDPVKSKNVEIVERKGLGHPDSIADGIAEAVSRKLCQEYRKRVGKVLHHNTDEVQIVAGKSKPELGGGEQEKPIYILLTGRATRKFKGEKIPVDKLAVDAARNYIKQNFKQLSPEHIEFDSRIGETSTDLKAVFDDETAPKSNDTSYGVGHAPLSDTEKIAKNLEPVIREKLEAAGEDIKIMAYRKKDKINITLAVAAISSKLENLEEYTQFKKQVEKTARAEAKKHTDRKINLEVNTADRKDKNEVYLTVTGTSAEMGDDGSVGRGNRVNGLITPERSMSMEASSGKNPVTHVGKIYNLLAHKISRKIFEETGSYAETKILSQIGKPIDQPQTINVQTESNDTETVKQIINRELDNINRITEKTIEGELKTF